MRIDFNVCFTVTVRETLITVGPVGPPVLASDEWRWRILETAGKWQGEFERPE